jgi:hypothetical protein
MGGLQTSGKLGHWRDWCLERLFDLLGAFCHQFYRISYNHRRLERSFCPLIKTSEFSASHFLMPGTIVCGAPCYFFVHQRISILRASSARHSVRQEIGIRKRANIHSAGDGGL